MPDLGKVSSDENWFTFKDFYKEAAKQPGYLTYVEVGVWKGNSVKFLAEELKRSGKVFDLYAVDLWGDLGKENPLWLERGNQIEEVYDTYRENLRKAGVSGLVKDIIGQSAKAATLFQDESVDFCFIDADHRFNSVKADIEAWLPKIKKGGLLCGHDFRSQGVFDAVNLVFLGKEIFAHHDQDVWVVQKD